VAHIGSGERCIALRMPADTTPTQPCSSQPHGF
jgi:hypothetical protein